MLLLYGGNNIKKTLSILLTACMLLSLLAITPLSASAETLGDYEYEVLDNGTACITRYHGDSDAVAIPSVIDAYTVSAIGDGAFKSCLSLSTVRIGNSVTTIGDGTFAYCNLTSVTISDSVTSIGGFAFESCTGLRSITIPDSVTSIGGAAFGYFYDPDNGYKKL